MNSTRPERTPSACSVKELALGAAWICGCGIALAFSTYTAVTFGQ